jgi:hypothetical protein
MPQKIDKLEQDLHNVLERRCEDPHCNHLVREHSVFLRCTVEGCACSRVKPERVADALKTLNKVAEPILSRLGAA